MVIKLKRFIFYGLLLFSIIGCKTKSLEHSANHQSTALILRHQIDTVGFAQYAWQMDSILNRIPEADKKNNGRVYKAVICPHDDYSYVGGLYAKTLLGIKAKTIILVGVAHRARNFELQDKVIFGDYEAWKTPDGRVKISFLRDKLLNNLHKETYIIHDSMMQLEHSLEAIVPFLQRQNPTVEILPLLIPYMKYDDMDRFSDDLTDGIVSLMRKEKLIYGKDIAVVISNDAVHYGDQDWGGSDMAPFGTDRKGTAKTMAKDSLIIKSTLSDALSPEKIKKFTDFTVKRTDYKAYNWIWCGRYAVPFGLLLANKINFSVNKKPLIGQKIDYRSSLDHPHIAVKDIGMGVTAPANNHHWVGYVGMAYE